MRTHLNALNIELKQTTVLLAPPSWEHILFPVTYSFCILFWFGINIYMINIKLLIKIRFDWSSNLNNQIRFSLPLFTLPLHGTLLPIFECYCRINLLFVAKFIHLLNQPISLELEQLKWFSFSFFSFFPFFPFVCILLHFNIKFNFHLIILVVKEIVQVRNIVL